MADLQQIGFGSSDISQEDNAFARKCTLFIPFKNENNKYCISIKNGITNFIVEFDSLNDALDNIRKIQANYYLKQMEQSNKNTSIASLVSSSKKEFISDVNEYINFVNKVYRLFGLKEVSYSDFIENKIPYMNETEINKLFQNNENVDYDNYFEIIEEINKKKLFKKEYVIKPSEMIIDKKELLSTRDALKAIISKTRRDINGKEVYDFTKISNITIQDYLLESLYDISINLTDNQKKSLDFYKKGNFRAINSIMRGSIDLIEEVIKTPEELDNTVKSIVSLHELFESMPKRNFDIVIGRVDNGYGQKIEQGARNYYFNFVSFGTDGGRNVGMDSEVTYSYKRILKGNESAIPVEMISQLNHFQTETEILTEPFTYSIRNIKDNNIEMSSISKISIYDSLFRGLELYKESLLKKDKSLLSDEENKKNSNFFKTIDNLISFLKEREMNPKLEQVKTEPLKYFDDKIFEYNSFNDKKTELLNQKKELLMKEIDKNKKRKSFGYINATYISIILIIIVIIVMISFILK